MTNPKLALIPSGYKGGAVYSILPSDGGGDFTFDRASEGTRVRKDGLIEEVSNDVPRLDWSDGNCPSLLLEAERTNDTTYSEDYTQTSYWGNVIDVVATKDEAVAPDGNFTANKIQANSGTNFKILRTNAFTIPSGVTMSMFVKKGNHDYIIFKAQGDYEFNLSTLQFNQSYSNVGYEDYGNGWIRLYATTSSSVLSYFGIYLTDSSFNQSWAATGDEFVYVWGAQYEVGDYVSTYIKSNSGGTTTRLFDDLESDTSYSTGNDVTWFLDFDTYTFENSFRAAMVVRNSGFTQTMDWISYNSGSDYYIRIRATNQSALQTIIAFGEDAIQMFTRNKVAVRLYGSNFEIYVNGTREYIGTSDDGDWTVLNNSAILNDFGTTSERPSTKLYDFRVYDQTMTQSELEELTTL